MTRLIPWGFLALLVLVGGIGGSCGAKVLRDAQARADSALAGARVDSAHAAHAEEGKRQALRERDSFAALARRSDAAAARLHARNSVVEDSLRRAIAALPSLPDTCDPAVALVVRFGVLTDSLRAEADSQARAAGHWYDTHVRDSLATVRADSATRAQKHRGDGLEMALANLRRVSARNPDRWLFGLPRPRAVLGYGAQASPEGRFTHGVQLTIGVPVF